MTADHAQSVLSVPNSENVNNNTTPTQSSINVSGKYTKYTSYTPELAEWQGLKRPLKLKGLP